MSISVLLCDKSLCVYVCVCFNLQQQLSSTALCVDSPSLAAPPPTSLRWESRLHQTEALLTWTGGRDRRQSRFMAPAWLTGGRDVRAAETLVYLRHLAKWTKQAVLHIQTAALAISPEAESKWPIGAGWKTGCTRTSGVKASRRWTNPGLKDHTLKISVVDFGTLMQRQCILHTAVLGIICQILDACK